MIDVFTPEKRSAVMRRVKGKDTGPELAVRRILRAAGIGYRLGGATGRDHQGLGGDRLGCLGDILARRQHLLQGAKQGWGRQRLGHEIVHPGGHAGGDIFR